VNSEKKGDMKDEKLDKKEKQDKKKTEEKKSKLI